MDKKKILILGAGFGGVRAALDLAHFGGSGVEVTLVDRNPYHIYTPDLYEVASAYIKEGRDFTRADFYRLANTAAVPLNQIFHKYKNVHLVQGEAAAVDLAGRSVTLADGKKTNYDWLIFALGSEPAFYDIPHISEYAISLKTLDDALNIRDAIDEALARLPKNKLVRVAIAGGGFAGVELAAELVDFLHAELKMHARPKNGFELTVIEAGAELFGGIMGRAGRLAAERLKKIGVRVLTNAKITDVQKEAVILADGKQIGYDVLVWTAGVCASRLASRLGVPTAVKGCLLIDDHLRLANYITGYNVASSLGRSVSETPTSLLTRRNNNVFVIGDAAYCCDKETGRPLPMMAQTAIHQGQYAAYTIRREMYGRRTFPYVSVKNRFIIPLGGRYAVWGGLRFCFGGVLPYLAKRFVSLYYFLSILPPRRAFRLWRRSVKIYAGNDIQI